MVKVKIVVLGRIAQEIDDRKVLGWKSDAFSICDICKFNLNGGPDLDYNRGFSNDNLIHNLPTREQIRANSNNNDNWDLTIYVTSVPLEYNYYSRILNDNRIVVTFHRIKSILKKEKIPFEYYLLRLIYAYTFIYMAKGGDTITNEDEEYLAHDDSRGCIFDMCGTYQNLEFTVISPMICQECAGKLSMQNVSNDKIRQIEKELKRLTLPWNITMNRWLERHPLVAIIISVLSAILLGLVGNCIWEMVKC